MDVWVVVRMAKHLLGFRESTLGVGRLLGCLEVTQGPHLPRLLWTWFPNCAPHTRRLHHRIRDVLAERGPELTQSPLNV